MLRLERISKIYPTGQVLRDVTWEVKPGDRIALVGVNGAGKTTQMKIVMGEIEPTSGDVIRPSSLKIAYLNQEFDVDCDRTIASELWTVFTEANQVQQKMADVHHAMESANPDELDKLITKLDKLQQRFES
ncbi:MAG: ATP-binding cassette domain-containing protein, partial [Cyanobacteria bacterium P01_H01_bin.15]